MRPCDASLPSDDGWGGTARYFCSSERSQVEFVCSGFGMESLAHLVRLTFPPWMTSNTMLIKTLRPNNGSRRSNHNGRFK
jgi:hypothetical protein